MWHQKLLEFNRSVVVCSAAVEIYQRWNHFGISSSFHRCRKLSALKSFWHWLLIILLAVEIISVEIFSALEIISVENFSALAVVHSLGIGNCQRWNLFGIGCHSCSWYWNLSALKSALNLWVELISVEICVESMGWINQRWILHLITSVMKLVHRSWLKVHGPWVCSIPTHAILHTAYKQYYDTEYMVAKPNLV